ncbi:MAG TPA: YggS family pyridoxal phosphate-dependent enzyme [Woeseiaceae bacterium]|nr:YggS family pyridoxal phosphate-dependent enzyme [Woeseiaceae bacterium]
MNDSNRRANAGPANGIPDMPIESVDDFRIRMQAIRSRVDQACHAAGREPQEVRILPVSKTVDVDRIRLAYDAGCRSFGENKVQEARVKEEALSELNIQWSVIGHLQTNKVKYVARFAHEFQALDSLRIAELLERRLQTAGRKLDVYVQVNSSGESSKYGLPPEDVSGFVKKLAPYSALKVCGLMTIAVFSADQDHVRRCFATMHDLRRSLRNESSSNESIEELSMGMSNDFEAAIAEGATVVRVGRALFGPRPLPDSYYWPAAVS